MNDEMAKWFWLGPAYSIQFILLNVNESVLLRCQPQEFFSQVDLKNECGVRYDSLRNVYLQTNNHKFQTQR